MSETVDVNILVYASDDASRYQPAAAALMDRLGAGPEPWYLLWPVISGYLRVATHPRVSKAPLSPEVAQANIDELLSRPHVRIVSEGRGFWPIYRRVAEQVKPRGNLVPDAHIVALMYQHGIGTIWTHDRGFRRFDGITVRDPFG
jgi:toxin-antitoxin system PIN domain toxin